MKPLIKAVAIAAVMTALVVATFLFGTTVAGKYLAGSVKTISGVRVVGAMIEIPIPEAPSDLIYNGLEQEPSIVFPDGVTVSGTEEALHAGTYSITLTLTDPVHSKWTDGTTENKTIPWRILPKAIPKPVLIDGNKVYTGSVLTPEIQPIAAEVTGAGTLSATVPGNYETRWSIPSGGDYVWEDQTTGTVSLPWVIGVCRIGAVLHPSVTSAFDTDLSTEETPVEMLVNWSENALNSTGEDWFSLNGFTLTSSSVTIENHAELTVLGGGTLSAVGAPDEELAVFRNTGTLVLEDGTFRSEYTGSNVDGLTANLIRTDDGSVVINGGTFSLDGGGLDTVLITQMDGETTINGGTFSAVNSSSTHLSMILYQEDGAFTLNGGSLSATADEYGAYGYLVSGGTIEIAGGTTDVTSENLLDSAVLVVYGTSSALITGGTHRAVSLGGVNGVALFDDASFTMEDGQVEIYAIGTSNAHTCNGILVSGGEAVLNGGTIVVESSLEGGSAGVGMTGGTFEAYGGTLEVVSTASMAYGMNVPSGYATIDGLCLTVIADFGSAYGFMETFDLGATSVESGMFFVRGDFASPGKGYSATHKILNGPANADCAFTLQYRSAYSRGENWTYLPYIASVGPIPTRSLSSRKSSPESGQFTVASGTIRLFDGTSVTEYPAGNGTWIVTETSSEEGETFLLELSGAEDVETETVLQELLPAVLTFTSEEVDFGLHVARPVIVRDPVRSGKTIGLFPETGLLSSELRPVGFALNPDGRAVYLEWAFNETGRVVRVTIHLVFESLDLTRF